MHAIRMKAHRAASHYDDDGTVNYNPFARQRSREVSSDVENQTNHRTKSEPNTHAAIAEQHTEGGKEFALPPHADTEPTVSPVSPVGDGLYEKEGTTTRPGASSESAAVSDKTVVDPAHSGLRGRTKFKKIFRKESESGVETNELQHVETEGLSYEERKRRSLKRKIPVGKQLRNVFFGQWINVLLIFVPVGFAVYYAHIKPVPVFIINFIAIIPLAAMLSYATEELAIRVGETFGGLLNATFGNAVELIVSIQALIKNEITIVKTSLIGSMLSNLLLVLGMSFFLGGINRLEQHFNVTVAQTAASLLALCIGSLIIPTVFHLMLQDDQLNTSTDNATEDKKRNQELSRGTAIILLFVYACYLVFQLKSHVSMYNAPSKKTPKYKSSKIEDGSALRGIAAIGAGTAAASGGGVHATKLVKNPDEIAEEEDDDIEEPGLSVIGALITLTISTTLVAFCSEFMVSSIEGVTEGGAVSTTFVGLILLPIVGNAAEHATAVTVAIKDKMDLSIGVAVGSSMQIALLVLPLVVVLGWILGRDCMTLYFDTFQIATLFVSVLLVNYLIQDGKSHWLEGMLLMCTYVIIALAAWFYPNINEETC
ncbi:vacuolar calcium ion transporter-like protein /H(+) exchanger [Amniculicola lignicola CBS 123094]|uniref:Vacuolar calcium ion transporter-like protein /H(+) exchanger n=1 Tax=Amniculicola lignicola CBS 123094 TaxID=1392246 RepID=A0A6A5VTU0_9PLEO|nr:vacuolar calcium ion transporter-like protein /H(+) exchanger [Amniculicola lignicola CBS 123094]